MKRVEGIFPSVTFTRSLDVCATPANAVIDHTVIPEVPTRHLIGRFYTRDALPVWTSFGKHFVIRPVIRL